MNGNLPGGEGVIKFQAEHSAEALDMNRHGETTCQLMAWREILAKLNLVGQDPLRYEGAGYGNVSARIGPRSMARGSRAMLITGTQTGNIAKLGIEHLCVVERYDYQRNWVESRGPIRPSSETMTHGAIYDLSPAIRYVLHAHSPIIWRNARTLRIPTTSSSIAYGTPEMARDVQRLYARTTLSTLRIFAMGGHEDGVVVFGESAEEAGETMVRYLARAYALSCATVL